jgi:hypothetical protein
MSISSVHENVKAALEVVLKAAGEQLPFHELGADHLSDAQSAPAIVWVPLGAKRIEQMPGGMRAPRVRKLVAPDVVPGVGEDVSTGRVQDPQMIATRAEEIEIHVWGKTFQDSERLLNHFVAAMRVQLTGARFHLISTDWTLGQQAKSKGYNVCLFHCAVDVPFTYEPQAVAKYPLTPTVDGEFVDSLDS